MTAWFSRSFDRFLVFGADGKVRETGTDRVWDERCPSCALTGSCGLHAHPDFGYGSGSAATTFVTRTRAPVLVTNRLRQPLCDENHRSGTYRSE